MTLQVLLLFDRPDRVAATVRDHIDALVGKSRHHVRAVEAFGSSLSGLDLDRFDAIVIHYSLFVASDSFVPPELRARLKASKALKAVFIQDEYRQIDRTIQAFGEIGLDILFTCMPIHSIESVYPAARLPGVVKINVLTGYVPVALLDRPVKPFAQRPIDVGYRARKVPAWLGDLGQEKWNIGRLFAVDAERYGLRCDITYREEARLYGDNWIRYVESCKAMLGVESGSSVFDFTGQIQAGVDRDVLADPDISYDELKRRHFADQDNVIDQRQISPRCFEAAALRTLMVLYRGDYSGRLEAWRHYVPLEKNHSNMDEVVAVLHDSARAQAIVDTAYREVALNPANHFPAHVAEIDAVIETVHQKRNQPLALAYTDAEFALHSAPGRLARRRRATRWLITYSHYVLFGILLRFLPEKQRDKVGRWLDSALSPLIAFARQLLGSASNRRST